MRRRLIHGLFALAGGSLLGLTLWQAGQTFQHRQTVQAVRAVPARLSDDDGSTDTNSLVGLARANALAAGGQFEAAEARFVRLIDEQRHTAAGRAAQYNLANLYLREGIRNDLPGATTRALLEIAKQRYRDVLRTEPSHWSARYNLELALRVAPERASDSDNPGPPPKSVRVIVPDFEADNLP